MVTISDTAAAELNKVLESPKFTGKSLILYYMGAGWSGPQLGMALDESTQGLEEINSNGIKVYIDSGLKDQLAKLGDILVDYITTAYGQSGYRISIGSGDCRSAGCQGCGPSQ